MIPILYDVNETAFQSNGIGRLVDCLRFEVTEERDGIFELEFDYPVTGQHYDDIIEGRVVTAIHDDNKDVQPFDIYGRSAPIAGIVTFFAHHVSYRLQYSILQPFSAASCAAAFAQMAGKCVTPCPFTFWTDKTTSGNFKVSAPVSVKEILGGSQGSILDVYGKGEYEWDKFTVKLHLNRGTDTGVQIRYGKNLVNLTQDVDTSGFYSAVVPYWIGGEDDSTIVTLPEWVVQSTAASGGSVPSKAVPLDLSDQWEEAPTEAQLRARALERVNSSEAWLPDENIKVDFVALWQTDEYANIAPLEQVRLCDRVSVIHPELGLVAEGVQVIKVVYDCLLERYVSMELGSARTSFASVVQAAAEAAILPQVPTKSFLQAAIDELSAEIAAGQGGIIYDVLDANGNRTEMLILCDEGVTADTPPEQCQHIWRINKAGIGYSDDYGQKYRLAITASGQIVADFITTGTMLANIIKGGTLTLGGFDNGSGVLVLQNANGQEIGRMDKNGANLLLSKESTSATIGDITRWTYNSTTNSLDLSNVIGLIVARTYATNQRVAYGITSTVYHNPITNKDIITAQTFREKVDSISNDDDNDRDDDFIMCHRDGKIYLYNKRFTNLHICKLRELSGNDGSLRMTGRRIFAYGLNGLMYGNKTFNPYPTTHDSEYFIDPHLQIARDQTGFCLTDYHFYVRSGSHTLDLYYSGLYVDGNKVAYASSSSRRYKERIVPLISETLDPHRLYNLSAVQFEYITGHPLQYSDMKGKTLPGFIAEDVAEIYPAAVIHGADGQVESWDERRIIPGLLALVQEQKQEIDALTARLEKLERLVAALVD